MVWYGMVWYGMVWYGMVWYGMVWYGMVWYGTVRYGMVWYGMVWYGMVWYGMVWYGMVWYGMDWYGNTLFNDAGPDSNLLISTGGRQNVNYLQEGKKKEIFTCEYFCCDHNYHLAIISSNNILKLVDRFGYLCVKREAIPQFSPTIIETLFEELSIWFRKG